MLDSVVINIDKHTPPIIFEFIEQVVPMAEVIDILHHKCSLELFITRKPCSSASLEKNRLDALQVMIFITCQYHAREVLRILVNLGDDLLDGDMGFILMVSFEGCINFIDIGNIASMESKKIAHKTVEQGYILGLPKALFHGIPVFLVELDLVFVFQTHEHIVTNEISLREIHTGGVEALENQLGIVLLLQSDIYNNQFPDSFEEGLGTDQTLTNLFAKELVIFFDTQSNSLRLLASLQNSVKRFFITLG